ncbi:MAG: Uma2 family endonuclease [Streptomycetaceae bacterium]|nr:Uma2 family endonuclease [Streptomycetaceae bacterium]
MDHCVSEPWDVTAAPLPEDIHSPDFIAAVATRILAHIERIPEFAAVAKIVDCEATPRGLLMQASPDNDRSRLLLRLRRRLEQGLGDRAADGVGDGEVEILGSVRISMGASERVPDLTVVDWGEHVDVRGGKAITPSGVMLLVEVTTTDRHEDLDRVDPTAKPRQYAAAGVPLYLVVDRLMGRVLLFANAVAGTYPEPAVYEFGEPVWLPKPLGFTLDTTFIRTLV